MLVAHPVRQTGKRDVTSGTIFCLTLYYVNRIEAMLVDNLLCQVGVWWEIYWFEDTRETIIVYRPEGHFLKHLFPTA